MPLNIEGPAEHPDVTALKQKVREAAKRHSSSYHCGSVKDWLRQAGIEDGKKLKVEITFTAFGTETKATKTFNESDLAGKTPEEQNAWVAEQITEKVTIAGAHIAIPLTVTDLNLVEKGTAVDGDAPDGFVKRFISLEGRVCHYVQESRLDAEGGRRMQYVTALCGTNSSNPYGMNSGWEEQSPRDEGRVCNGCAERAARLVS